METTKTLGRRTTVLLWLLIVSVVIGTLIYLEQIAVLYLLATVAIVTLLVIVGFSDLEKIGRNDSADKKAG
jgi:hypothetical protein